MYVVEGIKFIDSTETFEKQFTKSTFATVDKIDPSAYTVSGTAFSAKLGLAMSLVCILTHTQLLRDTTVSIAKHCKEFNSKGLGRLS